MPSGKQLKANREKALKGGVKTEAGKALVRLNVVSDIAHKYINNKFCGTNPISNFYGLKSPP